MIKGSYPKYHALIGQFRRKSMRHFRSVRCPSWHALSKTFPAPPRVGLILWQGLPGFSAHRYKLSVWVWTWESLAQKQTSRIHLILNNTDAFVASNFYFLRCFHWCISLVRQLCTSAAKCARKAQVGGHDVVIFLGSIMRTMMWLCRCLTGVWCC